MNALAKNYAENQPQQSNSDFMHPQLMLHGLLDFKAIKCKCNQNGYQIDDEAGYSLAALQNNISELQKKIDSMNHEVIQVEGLLSQRDMLYSHLDNLHAQREEIEDKIEQQEIEQQIICKKKNGGKGVKQMNERLRRRIKEVKEYIEKMEDENDKIEQNMAKEQFRSFYSQSVPQRGHDEWMNTKNQLYSDYYSPSNKPERTHKLNHDYFEGIRKRLQDKEKEAWSRIKRQEQEIQQRNARSQMNFGRDLQYMGSYGSRVCANTVYRPNKYRVYGQAYRTGGRLPTYNRY